jgi:hypothetical protein
MVPFHGACPAGTGGLEIRGELIVEDEKVEKTNYAERPPRWAVNVDTNLDDGSGRVLQARLWNVSEGGFSAECEEKLPVGARISIDLPDRGTVRAEVRWALGWRIGAMILPDGE